MDIETEIDISSVEKGIFSHDMLANLAPTGGVPTDNPGKAKRGLVEVAKKKLPGHIGNRYTKLVEKCLMCLDSDERFGEAGFLNH